jgi:hypothetical protein
MDIKFDKLIETIIDWGIAINCGNYKVANRKYKSINDLLNEVNKLVSIEIIIMKLLDSSEISVKYWAYVIALKNQVNQNIAISGLNDLSKATSNGAIGALAKIAIIEVQKPTLKFD